MQSTHARALQRVRACVPICDVLIVQHTIRQTCCDYPCLIKHWCLFCDSGWVAMLCPISWCLGYISLYRVP